MFCCRISARHCDGDRLSDTIINRLNMLPETGHYHNLPANGIEFRCRSRAADA